MSFRWPHQYVVSGSGAFPYDMLRYDEADFATLLDQQNAEKLRKKSIHIRGEVEPTIRRWESFGWSVSKVEALANSKRRN